MTFFRKKVNPRRQQVRESLASQKIEQVRDLVNQGVVTAVVIGLLFVVATTALLSFNTAVRQFGWQRLSDSLAMLMIVLIITFGAGLYIYTHEKRIIKNPTRAISLSVLFWILLAMTKAGAMNHEWVYLATGTAVTSAMILTIAYNQRFALGMSMFYSLLACFAVDVVNSAELFMGMMAGIVPCCYMLDEIRTRMKLIFVGSVAAVIVFVTCFSLGILQKIPAWAILQHAGSAALVTWGVGVIIQGFLPIIEKIFGVVTSMTLLDYSDANQPLLKKLAMEAPGTYTHSLLIGSIAETAAESIGANGLLCRVGAYYHDIGKINKPPYFIENQIGNINRHEQLSPAMSQLVIVGHVKDGVEIAKEFGLPAAIRQFIATHHGTTLIQYFYEEAKKQLNGKGIKVSESEFRYPGPKPQTKEAAIVMIADSVESAARALSEISPTKIEALVHNITMKRLQDGQLDDCDITLQEVSKIEAALSKALAAYHHGRIKYPEPTDAKGVKEDIDKEKQSSQDENDTAQ